MAAPLLATKLHTPLTRPELVPRRLLLEKLNAVVGTTPVATRIAATWAYLPVIIRDGE